MGAIKIGGEVPPVILHLFPVTSTFVIITTSIVFKKSAKNDPSDIWSGVACTFVMHTILFLTYITIVAIFFAFFVIANLPIVINIPSSLVAKDMRGGREVEHADC